MGRLDVLENKKLVLKNVLVEEVQNVPLDKVDEELKKFTNKLEILHVQTFGPLIIKTAGANIHEDGTLTTNYTFYVQAHDYKQYVNEFHIEETFTKGNMVLVRFDGKNEELHYAHSKLDLYFYENEYFDVGETYNVCIYDDGISSKIDIFKPVN